MDKESESGAGYEPIITNTNTSMDTNTSADTSTNTDAGANTSTDMSTNAPAASTEPATIIFEAPNASAPETTPVANTPADTVVVLEPPKKKKTGLIIGLVAAIFLILGGVAAAIWYFAVYQKPENVVLDAVSNFIAAKNVSLHGDFKTTLTSSSHTADLTITIDGTSPRPSNESSIQLTLDVRDSSGESVTDGAIEVKVGTVRMSDGVFYFQLDNLTETLAQILPNIFPPTNCTPSSDPSNCVDYEINPIETALYDIADLLDEEWWRVSLSDLLDEYGDELEDWQAEAIEDVYTCVINTLNADNSGEFSTLYRSNHFIDVEALSNQTVRPAGTTGYTVALNYDALANFLNAAKHSPAATNFYNCYNAAVDKASRNADDYYYDAEDFEDMKISIDDLDDVTAKDLEKFLPDNNKVTLFIDDWGHALREVDIELDDGDQTATLSLSFTYEPVEVSAPADYRPVTELVDEIKDIFYDLYYAYDDDDDADYLVCDEDDPDLCYKEEPNLLPELNI